MSENLRLGGTSPISLDSTNSNLPEGSTFTLPVAETSANHTAWATGISNSAGANTPHVYNTENNSYGNYYNWYTAVAGTANYNTVSQNNSGTITPTTPQALFALKVGTSLAMAIRPVTKIY